MNSKEALDNWYNTESPRTKAYEYELHYRLIKKDLEILEILKYLISHLEATFNTKHFSDSGIMGTIIKDYFINNDITGKIEEWLDNE